MSAIRNTRRPIWRRQCDGEARPGFSVEEGLELLGWAGQQQQELAIAAAVGCCARQWYVQVEVLPQCGAVRVGQKLRFAQHVGLARVVRGHLHAARGKAARKGFQNQVVALECKAKGLSDALAGKVVFRGAQAA
jgi:hypothetical protein